MRVDISTDDALITSLIKAAREEAEQEMARSILPQTWEMALDCFPDSQMPILLTMGDVIGVTSIKYLDIGNVLQTLGPSAYVLDTYAKPSRVKLAYAQVWPVPYPEINSVLVRYTAGYADAASVPESIKSWIKIRISSMYEHREEIIAGLTVARVDYVDRLLDRYKLWR